MCPSLPENEVARLEALHRYNILDTLPEKAYDEIVYLASYICGTPSAMMTLVDRDRQWFKSKWGLEASETPREVSFCAHAILQPNSLLVVPDATKDIRFCDNPLVTGNPSIRFYAGAPLVTDEQASPGTLCVFDDKVHKFSDEQAKALQILAHQVMSQLQLRLVGQELQDANTQLTKLACTDALTQAHNRGYFDERLREEIARARRYSHPLSLVLLDIDQFKSYNDTYGHPCGDDVLKTVVQILKKHCRLCDIITRYGGEEFAVILPDTPLSGAMITAERLRAAIQDNAWSLRPVTASFGVCELTPEIEHGQALVSGADRALYAAKHQGRNRVVNASDTPLN